MKGFGKIGIVFLVLVLALATLGIGYAMWDKTLDIVGTVDTGEVDAEFTTATCAEDPEAEDKDVGSCSVDGAGTQMLTITVDNGYPCYGCTVDYTITNTGTIPVKVQSMDITNPNTDAVTVRWTPDLAVGDQIEPGGSAAGDIYIHVLQDAAELASYSFSAEILLVQWNEYS